MVNNSVIGLGNTVFALDFVSISKEEKDIPDKG